MTEAELDMVMVTYWPAVLRRAMVEGDDWTRSFVKSIARAYKRPGWMPSPRQEFFMRRLLREMRESGDACETLQLIEEVDDPAA